MECNLIIKLTFKFKFYDHLASLWKGSFKKVCKKKIKIMIEEKVLNMYLKNSCNLGKAKW
jgi:hypothetical protein